MAFNRCFMIWFCRFCNFANVLSLQKFDVKDIDEIQKMIINEFKQHLEEKFEEINFTDFFGPLYETSPERFRFITGDIRMIEQIAEHVKTTVQKKGYRHFDEEKKRCETDDHKSNDDTDEVMRESLFQGVLDLLKPYGSNVTSRFERDMIEFSMEGGVPKGRVKCILCNMESIKKRRSASHAQYWNGNKWCLSNFAHKHLRNIHPIQNVILEEPSESIIEMEIEPIDLQSKIRFHNIQMINTSNNEQRLIECSIEITAGNVSNIVVRPIPADGNCLFGAIVHQYYRSEVGQDIYIKQVGDLRQQVVSHIKSNLKRFERELYGRLYKQREGKVEKLGKIQNIEKQCNEFLDEYLSKDHHWGGAEANAAVSELLKANIIIFNECGEVRFANSFEPSYEEVILLVHRLSKNNIRNHYDSIVKLSDGVIQECSTNLMEKYSKKCSMNNTSDPIYVG